MCVPMVFQLCGALPGRNRSQPQKKYNYKVDVIYPDYNVLQELVESKGMNCFYDSVENRKECCYIRKVAPFNAYLKDKGIFKYNFQIQ